MIIALCPWYSQRGENLEVSKGKTLAAAELGDIAFPGNSRENLALEQSLMGTKLRVSSELC